MDDTFSALTHETSTILCSLKTLSRQHAPIYTSIVREFTAIEGAQTILWTRARGLDSSESELLTLVGTYGEKACGYVKRIRLEYFAQQGELVGLREGLKGVGRVRGGEPVLPEAKIRGERGMVELRGTMNARMNARSPCEGLGGGVVVPVLGCYRVQEVVSTKTKIIYKGETKKLLGIYTVFRALLLY